MTSIPIPTESIPGCMFGANLVIPAQICELSCGQGKIYGWTDRQTDKRTDGRTDGQTQAMTIPLWPERPWGNKNYQVVYRKQGKSEGFDSCDRPSNLKLDSNFSARVIVKFDGWPRKTIGHFFYTKSSFLHHFKSIGEFKLDLQSRKAQFRSKLVKCYPVWPWNLMDDLGKQ